MTDEANPWVTHTSDVVYDNAWIDATHIELLLTCELSNSVIDERANIYSATGLSAVPPDPDDTEALELRRLPVDEAIAMAINGEITDALMRLAINGA
ncbi:MAG: hypothetical protein ACKVIQ_15805 [Acidimicrobiales bacterium]